MCLGEVGRIIRIDAREGRATVLVGEHERDASLVLHPDAQVGDEVVLHTGFVVEVVAADD